MPEVRPTPGEEPKRMDSPRKPASGSATDRMWRGRDDVRPACAHGCDGRDPHPPRK